MVACLLDLIHYPICCVSILLGAAWYTVDDVKLGVELLDLESLFQNDILDVVIPNLYVFGLHMMYGVLHEVYHTL